MRNILIQLLVSTLLVFGLSWALPGVDISGFWTALVVAIILGFLNLVVRPILIIITIPVTIVTLGLFLLVINAFMVMIAGYIVDGFTVDNFWWALLFSLFLSLLNTGFERERSRHR